MLCSTVVNFMSSLELFLSGIGIKMRRSVGLLSKYLDSASIGGVEKCVDPRHFRAGPSKLGGVGLFCDLDLEPGDIWFLQNPADSRYISQTIEVEGSVVALSTEWFEENGINPILCYYDFLLDRLVSNTEPFCRVNHSIIKQNSYEGARGNGYILHHVPAGEEILDPYNYEAVFSLAWKFGEFKKIILDAGCWSDDYLRLPVTESRLAMEFLATM